MSSLPRHCPISSLRYTTTLSSSSHLQALPNPSSRRLLIDEWDTSSQGHRQEDDDDFLLGFSLSSQGTNEDDELATPPSSQPDHTQICSDSQGQHTFLQPFPRSPSPYLPKSLIQANAPPLSSPPQALDHADGDEDDGAAEFERLMKQHESRRNVGLVLNQPPPVMAEPLPLDQPPSNDPLDLYFKFADEDNIAMEKAWTLRDDTEDDTRRALLFLESLMLDFCAQLHACPETPSCPGRSKARRSSQSPDEDEDEDEDECFGLTMRTMDRKTGTLREFTFPHEPRRTPKQPVLLHMTRILLVASVLYDAILNNSRVTLRDVYYRDVGLFKHQRVVDRIVDDLVATVGLKRDDLHVCAAAKGLMASKALKITLATGEELSLSSTIPTLIPRGGAIGCIEAPNGLEWILVVEKDTLCSSRLLDDQRLGPGVLVTGKGFPDLSTLQLLRRLADQFPFARICALVDADPHGIGILSVYAYGSKANRHSEEHSGLALGDRVEYMGVKATEWSGLARHEDLLPLSAHDAQLATKMCADLADVNSEWRRELVHMLHLNRKAEIQILSGPPTGDVWVGSGHSLSGTTNRLVEYIVSKLSQAN